MQVNLHSLKHILFPGTGAHHSLGNLYIKGAVKKLLFVSCFVTIFFSDCFVYILFAYLSFYRLPWSDELRVISI